MSIRVSYRLTAHRLRAWRRIATASADEANIDELERQSCEEIFLAREREYQDSYRQIPALDDLAARYGDTTNRRGSSDRLTVPRRGLVKCPVDAVE